MNSTDRKIYNEKYYATNKKRIADMLLKKVECPFCCRQVAYANLLRHQTTPLCHRNRKHNPTEIQILKEQVEKLTQEMNLLKSS